MMEQNENEDKETKRKYNSGHHKRQEKLLAGLKKDAAGSKSITSFSQCLSSSSSTTSETALSEAPNNDQNCEGKGRRSNYSSQ